MKVRWLSPALLIVLAVATLDGTAYADVVPITGTAFEHDSIAASFNFSGPGINVFSTTTDFYPIILNCLPGSLCDMTLTVPSALNFEGVFLAEFDSKGSVLGLNANVIGGELTFAGSAFIPTSSPNGTITIPVALTGTIQGYNVASCPGPCTLGDPLWNLPISGTGEATFSATPSAFSAGDFMFVDYTFTGTATVTPEPSSLVLLGTGLLAVAAWRGKKLI